MFMSPRLRKKIESEKAIVKKPFLNYNIRSPCIHIIGSPQEKNITAQVCRDCQLGSAVQVALAQLWEKISCMGCMQEAFYP